MPPAFRGLTGSLSIVVLPAVKVYSRDFNGSRRTSRSDSLDNLCLLLYDFVHALLTNGLAPHRFHNICSSSPALAFLSPLQLVFMFLSITACVSFACSNPFAYSVPFLGARSRSSVFCFYLWLCPIFDPDIYLATAFSSPVLQIPHIIGSCRSWFFFEGGYLMMTM